MYKCEYGCEQEGKYLLKTGKWCCSKSYAACPSVIEKITKKEKCPRCGKLFSKNGIKKHLKKCSTGKCLNCNKPITPPNKFCNHSCSATYNNKIYKKKHPIYCKQCGKELKNKQKLYCSNKCHKKYSTEKNINLWLNGELDGCSKKGHASYVKRWLLEQHDNKCEQCGWGETNPFTNTIPLEVEHIDGDCYNNRPENIKLLCPNCHSLTKTFRGANAGNGKRKYLKRYYTKKSKKIE